MFAACCIPQSITSQWNYKHDSTCPFAQDLVDSVNDMSKGNDWFLVANDFASYMDAQVRAQPPPPPFTCFSVLLRSVWV